jgi:uncharacterized damage-inducible protein DinB
MKRLVFPILFLFATAPASAQSTFQEEIAAMVSTDAAKFSQLAGALSQEQYAWRPAEGVRSSSEVLMHVAGVNYFMADLLGCGVPEGVAITSSYDTVMAFETETDRSEIRPAVEASFLHVVECIGSVSDADLVATRNIFGTPGNGRVLLVDILSHMSEHLGQLVAYTRVNGVVPPWSN